MFKTLAAKIEGLAAQMDKGTGKMEALAAQIDKGAAQMEEGAAFIEALAALIDKCAAWVGLRWSLNAGGIITRVIREEPDAPSLVDPTKLGHTRMDKIFKNCQGIKDSIDMGLDPGLFRYRIVPN